jgi:hypothetical protein
MNPWFVDLAKSLNKLTKELTQFVAEERKRRTASPFWENRCSRKPGHDGPCNGWPCRFGGGNRED